MKANEFYENPHIKIHLIEMCTGWV